MTYGKIRAEICKASQSGVIYNMALSMMDRQGILSTDACYARRWLQFSPLGEEKTHFEILNGQVHDYCCKYIQASGAGGKLDALAYLMTHESRSEYASGDEYEAGLEIYLALQNDSYTWMAIERIFERHFQDNQVNGS